MTPWSKTPPREPGWYWRKTRSSPSEQPMWSSGDGNKYPGDEYGARIPTPEDIEEVKDALREALRSTPETLYTSCSKCGDSTFEHVCNDSERPNPLHARLNAALAKLEGR